MAVCVLERVVHVLVGDDSGCLRVLRIGASAQARCDLCTGAAG